MTATDESLLQAFASHRDEKAFRALADRYLGLVFHTALRSTNQRQLAEDISQNILCALAQKASSLAKHPERLPAWLHRATLYESSKAMRAESSHQRRQILQAPATSVPDDSPWSDAIPHLDAALDQLPAADRRVVLLHFFENHSFPGIARSLGKSTVAVQKQSQRALDKLARLLRAKGVTLTATALATGLSAEFAKAAPLSLVQSATTAVLTGAATYSTTGLTLMLAAKSKMLIPLVVLLCALPLALQQVAISRAAQHCENLRSRLGPTDSLPTRSRAPHQPTASTRSVHAGRVTIAVLSRALDDARNGNSLKYLKFQEMIAALTPDELVGLIPEAVNLPESRRKKTDLLEFLVRALAKTDPALAVKTILAADPRGEIGAANEFVKAFSAWTIKDPDAACVFFQKLFDNRDFNPLTEGGYAWSSNFTRLLNEVVKSLVAVGSPHVRDVIFMAPESVRSSTFFSSIGAASAIKVPFGRGDSPNISDQNFANYLPLIREFIPQAERNQAFDRLVSDVGSHSKDFDQILGGYMDRPEILPEEKSLLAHTYARAKIGTYYETTPHPDLAAVEAAARQWLERHLRDEAEEILAKAKTDRYNQEMYQVRGQLERLAKNPDPTDSDLIQELGSKVYGEMLPQALEQAARIKDPAKRAEVIRRLQNP